MILHLFYKEWIKTRWAFLGALIIGICIVFYIFIMVENRMTMLGAKNYTLSVLYNLLLFIAIYPTTYSYLYRHITIHTGSKKQTYTIDFTPSDE